MKNAVATGNSKINLRFYPSVQMFSSMAVDTIQRKTVSLSMLDESRLRSRMNSPKALKTMGIQSRLTLATAFELIPKDSRPAPLGDAWGIAIGVMGLDWNVPEEMCGEPLTITLLKDHLHPLHLLTILPNMPASHLAIELGVHGPSQTVASKEQAHSQAIRWLEDGEAAHCISGFVDGSQCELALLEWK